MKRFLTAAILLLLITPFLTWPVAHADEVRGQGSPIDGDSFNLDIRLFGIDAPEAGQSCKDASGQDYPCGRIAHDALRGLLQKEIVRCELKGMDDRGERPVAICYADGIDIGGALVDQGLAVASRAHTEKYVPNEERAKADKRGLWAGEFEWPWLYRERVRNHSAVALFSVPAGACPPPPADPRASGCLIIGNVVNKKKRIYHVPGSRDYKKVTMKPAEGDRYFCSQEEAVMCGFRKPGK